MPKITNPVIIAKLRAGVLAGKPDNQVMIEAGLSEHTANHKAKETVILNVVKRGIGASLSDDYIIEQLQAILKLKMSVERKLFEFIDRYKRITPQNLRNVTLAINKTKDNITEISKLLRLYNGDSTENLNLSDEETTSRRNRLIDMARGIN